MRVFRTTVEGCLGEITLQMLHRMNGEIVEKKVKTMTGISLRKMTKVQVEHFARTKKGYKSLGVRDVWADWITGTLYGMDGKCLSSDNLMLVETDEKPYCSIKEMMNNFRFGHGTDYEYGSN
jgi:hypothetical protein